MKSFRTSTWLIASTLNTVDSLLYTSRCDDGGGTVGAGEAVCVAACTAFHSLLSYLCTLDACVPLLFARSGGREGGF